MILKNRMIYFLLFSTLLFTSEYLTNATSDITLDQLFELINSEL